VTKSKGHFDNAEYERQLKHGAGLMYRFVIGMASLRKAISQKQNDRSRG